MNKSEAEQRKQSIIEELQRLKHLRKTRMLSLDDGLFVRSVVAQMNEAIARLEAELKSLQNRKLGDEATAD